VHDLQRRTGCFGQRAGVVDQAAERAGAAFGALDEQCPAALRVGQSLAGQLAVFQLERGLDAAFQAIAAVTAVSGLTAADSRVTRMLRRSST